MQKRLSAAIKTLAPSWSLFPHHIVAYSGSHPRKASPMSQANANLRQDGHIVAPQPGNVGFVFSSSPIERSCQIRPGSWATLFM
jgi:hypothetical protein